MSIRVAFLTLGCPKNEADTDAMRASILSSAYHLEEDVEKADIVVINSCSFIAEATEESINLTLQLAEEWLPNSENRKLIVAGCMPSRYGETLNEALGEVDAFVPVLGEGELLSLIHKLTGVSHKKELKKDDIVFSRTLVGTSAYVKISDGCDRTCSFCAIPAIRGPYKSRPREEILTEVSDLVKLGAKEVILIGQDTSIWGKDFTEPSTLASLLQEVASLSKDTWVRVMYLQPETISDELLNVVANTSNICSYFDIPLQHASRRVLRAMGRAGSYESFITLIKRIRSKVDDAVLRTTLIAGFPGETQQESKELQCFVEEVQFDYTGVFVYSPEEGTSSADLPNQIPLRTRKARAQRLRDLGDSIAFKKCSERIGEVHQVLIEEIDFDEGETAVLGRWMGQAPEIDGQVHVTSGSIGEVIPVRFTDTFCYEYEGEII